MYIATFRGGITERYLMMTGEIAGTASCLPKTCKWNVRSCATVQCTPREQSIHIPRPAGRALWQLEFSTKPLTTVIVLPTTRNNNSRSLHVRALRPNAYVINAAGKINNYKLISQCQFRFNVSDRYVEPWFLSAPNMLIKYILKKESLILCIKTKKIRCCREEETL